MSNHKAVVDLMLIAYAFLIAIFFFFILQIAMTVKIADVKTTYQVTMLADERGSELLAFMNSGENGMTAMERLGSLKAGQTLSGAALKDTLDKMEMGTYTFTFSETGFNYGRDQPPDAFKLDSYDMDVPLPGGSGQRAVAEFVRWI